METTVNNDGAVVRGRVLDASGAPIPFADVRLFYQVDCGVEPQWVGISAKTADENGRYSWDYVAKPLLNRILAVNGETDEFRNVQYTVQRQGQQLNVDIVFLGRGSIQGVVRSEAGVVLPNSVVRVTSLTDQSQVPATTDASGRYAIARVPVGNLFIEAVNVIAKAQLAQAEMIPMAGAVVKRDLTLLDVEQRKVTVKHGTVRGRVYREDGVTPVSGLPVFAYYYSKSQTDVSCPRDSIRVRSRARRRRSTGRSSSWTSPPAGSSSPASIRPACRKPSCQWCLRRTRRRQRTCCCLVVLVR